MIKHLSGQRNRLVLLLIILCASFSSAKIYRRREGRRKNDHCFNYDDYQYWGERWYGKGKGYRHGPQKKTPYRLPLQSNRLVINMVGSSIGERITFPESDLELLCFEELPLRRLDNGNQVGKGNDCISISNTEGDVSFISDTTTFDFKGGGFTVVTAPFVIPTETDSTKFIVSTEIASDPPTQNNIVGGNGCFSEASGSVRLSGFMEGNMTSLDFFFDYIFVMDFTEGGGT